MDLSKDRIRVIIIFTIGTLIMVGVFYFLSDKDKTVVNAFTLFGTFFSLFGLAVAYIQIQSINKTSQQTKLAIEKSLLRINQVLSVSELSKANKTIQEIQSFLLHQKYEIALMRMKDLKSILIQVKYNEDLSEYTKNGLYNQNITDLGSDLNNLHDLIIGTKKGVSFSRLNQNLENLATTLTEFENKLKYKEYDT
jgi:hypothetical protein